MNDSLRMYADTKTLLPRRESNPCRGTPRISWSGVFNEPRIRGAPRNPNAHPRGVQPHGPRLCIRAVATKMAAGQTLAQGTRCNWQDAVAQLPRAARGATSPHRLQLRKQHLEFRHRFHANVLDCLACGVQEVLPLLIFFIVLKAA